MTSKRKTARFGAFKNSETHKGYTIKELYALVKQSREEELGIDALGGDDATGARIIEDLLTEIRRLKTELALSPE